MRYVLCLWMALMAAGLGAQDFASRFMTAFEQDSLVCCQTVSPKMMSKLLKVHEGKANTEEWTQQWARMLTQVKSVRFITGRRNGESYFRQATQLMAQNKNRFHVLAGNPETPEEEQVLYARKRKNIIVELVLLSRSSDHRDFHAVDITGQMDEELIRQLTLRKEAENP